jgi:putative PEP-CTERM system TPR-repeat lipoprotein
MPTLASTSRIAIVIALAALVAACSGGDPDKLLASAKDYLAKHDTKSAEIQLKNALEKAPDMAEARYLLGRTLLENGDVPAAEKELRRARDLKYPAGEVDPPLATAWVRLGQYQQVIDRMSTAEGATPTLTAELKTAMGQAQLGLGKTDLAKEAFAAAQASDPRYAPAILGDVVVMARAGDYKGASAANDKALALAPNLTEALQLKGDILLAQGRVDDAGIAFANLVDKHPQYLAGHWALISVLVRQGKVPEADKALEQLKSVAPKNAKTYYYEALVRVSQRNFAAARDSIQQELALVPDEPVGTLLAAAIDFELHAYERAETTLTKVLSHSANNDFARRLLVATYLQLHQPARALETLKPMLGRIDRDPAMQNVAGEVYLQNGDATAAAEYFEKAVALDPKGVRGRTGLAMTRIALGDTAAGVSELEAAAAADSGVRSDLMLISVALRKKQWDDALSAIAALEKKQPNHPLAPNLRGLALMGKGDLAGARASFDKALTVDPSYFPAVASLARIDLAEKKSDAARKRFEEYIAKNPKSSQAMLALAEVLFGSGAPQTDVLALIDRAIKTNPTEVEPRLALVRQYLRQKEPRKAVLAAQDATTSIPNRPELWEALGQAQQTAGQPGDALTSFRRFAEFAPGSPIPYMRMGELHIAQRDAAAAADDFRHALAIKPDFIDAQKGLAAASMAQGRVADALSAAKDAQRQRPKEAAGFILEGDIYATRQEWSKSVAAYRQAVAVQPATEAAARLHAALVNAGQAADADKAASTWLRDHPKDDAYRFAVAEQATRRKDYATALRYYQQALESEPANAILLNNYAWVAGQANDPHAIEYAERANKIAPNQPRILDTLGALLVAKGDAKRGVELLQQAVSLAPQMSEIRLNLARAYVKTGQAEAAKKELDTLAGLGDKFAQQDEVARLRRGL